FIAPWWDDLHQRAGTLSYSQPSASEIVFQYANWGYYSSSSTGNFTLQVRLKDTGEVQIQYGAHVGASTTATAAGFENNDGTVGMPLLSCAATGANCYPANWPTDTLFTMQPAVRNTPQAVAGLAGVGALASMGDHSCAVVAGGVKCWGANSAGELGDGTFVDRGLPVDVVLAPDGGTPLSGVVGIGGGHFFTCAVLSSGGLKCWGANESGQLGNGTTTPSVTPLDVPGVSAAVAVAGGGSHACALLSDGSLKCWGANGLGQLGDGTLSQRSSAVAVTGLDAGVTAITAGNAHTCALTVAGGVKCWGDNAAGALGNGSGSSYGVRPADVSGR
ncbi:MAG: RCC1 domain-containing protein, partial [Myxococcaceae bacterium]